MAVQGHPRWLILVVGTIRKHVCNFLLVIKASAVDDDGSTALLGGNDRKAADVSLFCSISILISCHITISISICTVD